MGKTKPVPSLSYRFDAGEGRDRPVAPLVDTRANNRSVAESRLPSRASRLARPCERADFHIPVGRKRDHRSQATNASLIGGGRPGSPRASFGHTTGCSGLISAARHAVMWRDDCGRDERGCQGLTPYLTPTSCPDRRGDSTYRVSIRSDFE